MVFQRDTGRTVPIVPALEQVGNHCGLRIPIVFGTDLTGAKTSITSFLGTDLRNVKGLTQAQLDVACGDTRTK